MHALPSKFASDVLLLDLRYEDLTNISHLLAFAAPLPLLIRSKLSRPLNIILPRPAPKLAEKVLDSLGLSWISTNRDLEGDFILGPTGHERVFEPLYRIIFEQIEIGSPAPANSERLFIARRGRRRIDNEMEVDDLLSSYGFRKVYYEDYTVSEQWQLSANAEAIVAQHGAALSSLLFNRRSVKVVEIFHPGFSTDFFRRICCCIGAEWRGVHGKIPAQLTRVLDERGKARAFAFSSTTVHSDSLKMALTSIGIAKPRAALST
jgi:hypothetical protein